MTKKIIARRTLLCISILIILSENSFAGACTENYSGVYTCSGKNNDELTLVKSPLVVNTTLGFSVDTSDSSATNGFSLHGDLGIEFLDENNSLISGGLNGISAVNSGSGSVSIITNGTVVSNAGIGSGISVINGSGVSVINKDDPGNDIFITANNVYSKGTSIVAENRGAGTTSITTTGNITSTDGIGIEAVGNAGNMTVNVSGEIKASESGIYTQNFGFGKTSIDVVGDIIVTDRIGYGKNGIDVTQYGDGLDIKTDGTVLGYKNGISVWNDGTDVSINTDGKVIGLDEAGIRAISYFGVDGRETGVSSITTRGEVTGKTYGIESINVGGTDLVIDTDGYVTGGNAALYALNNGSGAISVKTSGSTTSDGIGIFAENHGTELNIHNDGNVIGGTLGISASNDGSGIMSIINSGSITGEDTGISATSNTSEFIVSNDGLISGQLSAILASSESDIDFTLNNSGVIKNTSGVSSDLAISTNGVHSSIRNSGNIVGVISHVDSSKTDFINAIDGLWDSSGGVNNFGDKADANSLVNYGKIITANNSNKTNSPQVTIFNNVGTLTNAGIISMANGRAGDTTIINGDYVGNGGSLLLDTALGGDTSVTDRLEITGTSSGTTYVSVSNSGGSGAKTLEGIEVIRTGQSTSDAFIQKGRIVAGSFDYRLHQGSASGSNQGSWYLTSKIDQTDPSNEMNILRPESGSYTANLAAVNNMFVSTLNDRMGEIRYRDVITGEEKTSSMWLRNIGGHNRSHDNSAQLHTIDNRYVVQMGGDLVRLSEERLHLGVMAGYGNSKSKTVSNVTENSSRGSVSGYSIGLYGTWYDDIANKTGLYLDSWAQYGWFNNTVSGDGLQSEKYKSSGVTASVEGGYTYKIGENKSKKSTYFIQPKAQVTWMGVKADNHTETNGTRVSGEGDGNVQTRLGLRAFLNGTSTQDKDKDREFQPFIEANWLHNSKNFGTRMNEHSQGQKGTKNIAELKVGVEGKLNGQLNVWGNVNNQIGSNGYSDTQVLIGFKYNF